MKTYFARLIAPRPTFGKDMTPAEGKLMQSHAVYLRELLAKGQVVVFGVVGEPRGVYGIAVFEVEDAVDVMTLTNGDPTIKANVGFSYEVTPMPMGAVHK